MSARIKLPDGRIAQHEFPVSFLSESEVRQGWIHLYFSENIDFLLADYLEVPYLRSIEIEKISRMDGIALQIQMEDAAKLHPRSFYFHAAGQKNISGKIASGLFNWFWNLQIQGSLPDGPFRLSIEFA